MKNTTKLIFGTLILSAIGVVSYFNLDNANNDIEAYVPRHHSAKNEIAAKPSIELFEELRRNVNTGKLEASDFANAWQAVQTMSANRSSVLTLVDEGPDNVGGRTRAILVDKNNNNIVYAGSVSGGLFKSINRGNTWSRVAAFSEVLSISSLAQTPNGTIYVGTGTIFENDIPTQVSGGHKANGVYYTTDDGATFNHLNPTPSWGTAAINAIVADPIAQDKIYVGGSSPVRLTEVVNKTTFNSVAGIINSVTDVKISPDGSVVIAAAGVRTYVKEGSGSFTRVSGTGAGKIKETANIASIIRIEYAISDVKNSNNKYSIYASMVKSGSMLGGVSASHDNGQNWTEIIPETPNGTAPTTVLTTDPFANGLQYQGRYDNTISVMPGSPKSFIIGGINLHQWNESTTSAPFGQMSQLSSSQAASTSAIYVHADNHELVWDNTGRLYVGNDGGVGILGNAGFYPANRGYNVTQFYGIGYSQYGDLIGGAQDNGTQYKDVQNPGTSSLEYREVTGGDGFDCEISNMNENILFTSIYTAANYRSATKGGSRSSFTSTEIDDLSDAVKPFYNVTRLYEDINDVNSKDSIWYFATEDKAAGETIMVNSKNFDISFPYVLPTAINVTIDTMIDGLGDTTFSYLQRDTLRIQDVAQSMFALGLQSSGGVWVTRQALRFGETPVWWKVLNSVSGRVTELEFSKDGNILYVGTSNGVVTRIKGFNNVYFNNEANDTVNGIFNHDRASYEYADVRSGVSQLQIQNIFSGQYVTGIAVDPNNEEHVVITLGGYGASTNIRRSTTAASTTSTSSFASIKGNMPTMPVYDAVIDMSDPSRIIAGTEFGVMLSTNTGGTWSAQNDEMGVVPVYDVRQQYRPWTECFNSGMVYFGTHGRGIWSSSDYIGIEEKNKENEITVSSINLFPNPVVNFTKVKFDLTKSADVVISVYSLTGQLISTEKLGNRPVGELTHRINASNLPKGIYFVNVQAEGMKFKSAKFIKQ